MSGLLIAAVGVTGEAAIAASAAPGQERVMLVEPAGQPSVNAGILERNPKFHLRNPRLGL
jgi:hypothetical protein